MAAYTAETHPQRQHFANGGRIVFGNKADQFESQQLFGVCDNVIITSYVCRCAANRHRPWQTN